MSFLMHVVLTQRHFITAVLRVGEFPYVHWHLGAKRLNIVFYFYPCSIATKLAHGITLMEWLKVSSSVAILADLLAGFSRC